MSDILQTIIELSLNVSGNDKLQQTIDKLKEQAAAVERLKGKLGDLQKYYDTSQNQQQQERAKSQIDKTTSAIDKQTAALERNFKNNTKIQAAISDEIGLMQQLTQYIAQATKERETLTDVAQIKRYTDNIKAAQAELKALITPLNLISDRPQAGIIQSLKNRQGIIQGTLPTLTNYQDIARANQELGKVKAQLIEVSAVGASTSGFKGVLAQIFGVSSEGALGGQILKGLVRGAGIGIGFQIIPGLIANLEKYVISLTHADEEQLKASESAKTFSESLVKEIDTLTQVAELTRDIVNVGDAQYKRDVANAKAIGTIRGEQYQASQRIFDAEQAARTREIDDIKEKQVLLTGLGQANVAAGPSGKFQDVIDDPGKFGISTQVTDVLKQRLVQAKKDGISLKDLYLQLSDENVKQLQLNDEKLKNLDAAQKTAATEREAKFNSEIYELDKKLQSDIRQLRQQRSQFELSILQTDTATIKKSIKDETDFRIANIERERKEQRQKLPLDDNGRIIPYSKDGKTLDPEKDFSTQIQLTRTAAERKTNEELRKLGIERYNQQEKLNDELLAQELQSANQRLKLLTGVDLTDNISLLNTVADKELALQLEKNSKEYTSEVDSLNKLQSERKKRGETQTQDYAQTQKNILDLTTKFSQAQEDAETANSVKRIENIREGYAQVIREVDKNNELINQKIKEGESQNELKLSKIFTFDPGGVFGKDFYEQVGKLKGEIIKEVQKINEQDQKLIKANEQLGKGQEELSKAKTPETIKAANDLVENAKSQISQINTEINKAQSDINSAQNEIQKKYIDQSVKGFQTLVNAAADAYAQLSDFRQQDLDREIQVREQRVSVALKLAEKGNTQALDIERNALKASQEERRKDALRQQQINALIIASNYALAISQSVIAITKTAAQGGALAPVLIPAIVAAIAGGIATTLAIVGSSKSSQTTGFKEGGYTGDKGTSEVAGVVHGKEFVSTAATTAKYRPILEAMHNGSFPQMLPPKYINSNTDFANRKDLSELKGAIDNVADAVAAQRFSAKNVMDSRGVFQMIEREQRKERIKRM